MSMDLSVCLKAEKSRAIMVQTHIMKKDKILVHLHQVHTETHINCDIFEIYLIELDLNCLKNLSYAKI